MENMNELYSDIILEHNQCQENKHPLEDANLSEHGHNPSTAVPSARLRRTS